jgi:ribonucleoside-diphosphate reductase subunit M2
MGDSPAKKLNFSVADKENSNVAVPVAGIPDIVEPIVKKADESTPSVAGTIKATEAHEPLLQENPQRFVLFPIQHHDVCFPTRACDASKLEGIGINIHLGLAHVQEGNGVFLDSRGD